MATEAQRKAVAKYNKAHTKAIQIKLNTTTDRDIIERLDNVDSKQGYIKKLIRTDIENNNTN